MKQEFHIPRPPSVNCLYANGTRRRIISKRYEEWLRHAGYVLNGQDRNTLHGPAIVSMVVNKGRADLSNLEKAPLDLLVKHGVMGDDSQVVGLHMRHEESAGDIMFITVEAA